MSLASEGAPAAQDGMLTTRGMNFYLDAQDFRKLLVGVLYARRWLTPHDTQSPIFEARNLAWLDDLVSWAPIPRSALARI